jgi:uncharacterized protein (DUF885 family)
MRNLLKEYYDALNAIFPEFGGFGILTKQSDLAPWFFFNESKLRKYLSTAHHPAASALSDVKQRTVNDQILSDLLDAFDIWQNSTFFQSCPINTMFQTPITVLELVDDDRVPAGKRYRVDRINLAADLIEEYHIKMRARQAKLPKIICTQLVKKLSAQKIRILKPADIEVTSAAKRCRAVLDSLTEWLKGPYSNACKSHIGCGVTDYLLCVKYFTGVLIDPEQMFSAANARIAEINKEIANLLPPGDTMRKAKARNTVAASKVLEKFVDAQRSQRPAIRQNFYDICSLPTYTIKGNNFRGDSGIAFCLPATSVDPTNNVIIDLNDPVADFEITPLILHEGDTGHAFHIQYMLDSGCQWWQVSWLMFTGLIEGWALYAEELGGYNTNLERVGQLSMELWRAARVAVDIGIHCLNWTQKKAEWFLYKNSLLSKARVEKEILRYISMPGQALSYWMGKRWIKRLREKFSDNDVREFHHKLLSNGIMQLSSLDLLFENKLLPNGK